VRQQRGRRGRAADGADGAGSAGGYFDPYTPLDPAEPGSLPIKPLQVGRQQGAARSTQLVSSVGSASLGRKPLLLGTTHL
jgi:hypothetical protein